MYNFFLMYILCEMKKKLQQIPAFYIFLSNLLFQLC